jgi:hypothetical protein
MGERPEGQLIRDFVERIDQHYIMPSSGKSRFVGEPVE